MPPGVDERYQHILLEAVRMFGPDEGAKLMTTRNFALGGRTPAELALTKEGTRQVHHETLGAGARRTALKSRGRAWLTRHYNLCWPMMGQFGQIGPSIKAWALARVMATRRIFRLR